MSLSNSKFQMKYSLFFLLIICAVPSYYTQRRYPCGSRPCSPQFDTVCGWKSTGDVEVTIKMFPNVCIMEEENDCNESDSNHWILYDSCPSQLPLNKESLRAEYQKQNEEDEEDLREMMKELEE